MRPYEQVVEKRNAVLKSTHSGGASTPPDSKRIVCGAFYEVEMFPLAHNESNFNSLLSDAQPTPMLVRPDYFPPCGRITSVNYSF